MPASPVTTAGAIEQEALALLARLDGLRPFALLETMVPAAAPSAAAQVAIDRFLSEEGDRLRADVGAFLAWLRGPGRAAGAEDQQRRFVLIRMRFNAVLSHVDLFSDAISQRSEAGVGVLLAGLEVAAADALALPGAGYEVPPIVCYLDRGPGAAIRRARTRLPGGRPNPVSLIRVPRERMVGSGVASSLFHEVGHQGAALLGLVASLRDALNRRTLRAASFEERAAWTLWSRWTSEIVADLWAIGRVGITSTAGLLAVVSLPRYFVFRAGVDDPHPMPWVRVLLSCALGDALYPHEQWARLAARWQACYPLAGAREGPRATAGELLRTLPELVELLTTHRTGALEDRPLGEALRAAGREPERLQASLERWRADPAALDAAPPSLVFAAVGQARFDGRLGARQERDLLTRLLTDWALRGNRELTRLCADRSAPAQLPPTALVPAH